MARGGLRNVVAFIVVGASASLLPTASVANAQQGTTVSSDSAQSDVLYEVVQSTTPYPYPEGPGSTDIGNHCDDCTTQINFPFPVHFYGQTYTSAMASSNGNLQFTGNSTSPSNGCLPNSSFEAALFLFQTDLRTNGTGDVIRTNTYGTPPNRVFVIEWVAHFFVSSDTAHFTATFFENDDRIQIDYFGSSNSGATAVAGVQASGTGPFTQNSCQTAALTIQKRLTYEVVNELNVDKAGAGSGRVTSSPAGIDCGSTCSAYFDGDEAVTLSAQPAAGSLFTGWSGGACTGTETCVVSMASPTTITATFELENPTCPGFENDPRLQIVGTSGENLLVGTAADEVICGLGGNDELRGAGGADLIIGAGGNDVIKGGGGPDRMRGGAGNDLLFGGRGRDVAKGGSGRDLCRAEVKSGC